MDCFSHFGTFLVIIIFSLDIFTDVSTGVELILNDQPYCEYDSSKCIHSNEADIDIDGTFKD